MHAAMKTLELTDKEAADLARFIPATVKRRKLLLEGIVEELRKRGFRRLDENDREDIEKVRAIVCRLHPESAVRTTREYARTAIFLWNKEPKQT